MKYLEYSSKLATILNIYFIIITIILMFLHDGYLVREHFLSRLGTSEIGWIFNTALMALGISLLFHYFSFFFYFKDLNRVLRVLFIVLATINGVSLTFVGIFVTGGPMSETHDFLAILFFLLLMPLFLILAYFVKQLDFGNYIISMAILTTILTFIGLFIPGVNQYIFQKLIVYSYNITQAMLGRKLLTNYS